MKANTLFQGSSGKMGNLVFYNRYGKTHIRKAPAEGYNKVPTKKQELVRAIFLKAHQFAQWVINSPELKAVYNQRAGYGHFAYHVAFKEYMQYAKRK